jgi:predicted dehydrogenase
MTSSPSVHSRAGTVEISGTEGTIVLPDPSMFDGDGTLWRFGGDAPITWPAVGYHHGRGSGVVDLARALRGGQKEIASGDLAVHVLDTLLAISDSAEQGRSVDVASSVARPQTALPEAWNPTQSTLRQDVPNLG